MRPLFTLALITLLAQSGHAESFTSSPTQMAKKIIYARAAGEVSQLNLRSGQVFLWDEFAAHVTPKQDIRPEFGRVYSDFAGAVTRVLAEEGQQVDKGDPLYECQFMEHVYTSCIVPDELQLQVDQALKASIRGHTFDAKVLAIDELSGMKQAGKQPGATKHVRILIYNTHEERYWHLTPGQQVQLDF